MEKKNFLNSAAIAALAFGLISSIVAVVNGYMIIGSEPTGSMVPPGSIGNILVCLLGAFASLLAVKLHVAEEPVMLLGRGAVIGLVTGLILAVFITLFGVLWEFADPEYNAGVLDAMKRHFEQIPNFSEEQIEQMMGDIEQQFSPIGRLKGMGISAAVLGILNALTGLLGAKMFADRPDESL